MSPVAGVERPLGIRAGARSPEAPAPSIIASFRWWGTAWFTIGAVLGCARLGDNSFLTHLATGRLIVDGRFPHSDPYSFTARGAGWVVQSWLASALYAGTEWAAGPGAVRVLVALTTGLLAAGVWRLTRRIPAVVARVVVTGAVMWAGVGWWNERPQTFGALALVAALLVVVEDRRAAWLVPLFAAWIGFHGSWVVGVALVGLVALGSAPVRPVRRSATYAGAAGVGAVAGAVASPYGTELLLFPFRLAARGSQLAAFKEWQRPGLLQAGTLLVAGMVVLALLGAARERRWRWLPLVLVVVALCAQAQRNLPVAALALLPAIESFLLHLRGERAAPPPRRRPVLVAGAAVVALVGVGVAASGPHFDLRPYPVALVDHLDERGWIANADVHVVAPDWVGNYLDLRDGASAQVFVDDRAEVFPTEVHDAHLTLLRDRPGWDDVLDRWAVDVVVWPEGKPLVEHLDADAAWREVERSDGFVALCRVGALDGC